MQSSLAFTDLAKGLPQQGMDTATEVATQSANMGLIIKFFMKNFERTYGKNVFRDCLRYCQLFLTEEKAYRIAGPGGSAEILNISPSEILGDYDFWFDWSTREVNARIQIAEISNFMQSLNQIQTFTPIHGLLVQAQLRNLNMWNKEETEQAVKDTFQQMQQVQMMQAKGPVDVANAGSPPTDLATILSNIQSGQAPNVQPGVASA